MTVLFIARGLKVDNIKLPVFKQVFLTSPVDWDETSNDYRAHFVLYWFELKVDKIGTFCFYLNIYLLSAMWTFKN